MSQIVLPSNSFWSMLPQITSQAIGQYQNSQDRTRAQQELERQHMLQQLGILQTAAGQGSDVNGQISELMSKLGMSGVTPADTPAQMRQRIMNTPDMALPSMTPEVMNPDGSRTQAPSPAIGSGSISGLDKYSDTQRAAAGVQTRGQVLEDKAGQSNASATITLNGIKAKAAAGQSLTPAEKYTLEQAGGLTPDQQSMTDAGKVTKFVGEQAPAYISEWLLKNGNRIEAAGKHANTDQIVDQAYGAFKERFGDKIPDDMDTNARAQFAQPLLAALHDQDEMDLKREQMNLQLAIANLRKKGTADPETSGKLADQINRTADGYEKQLAGIPKEQQTLFMGALMRGVKPGDPSMGQANDSYKQFVEIQTRLTAARSAAALVSRGLTDDPQIQHMLDIAAGVDQAQADKPPAGGTTPQVRPKTRDGREIITADQKAYLMAHGTWDVAKYVVQ